MVTMDLNDLALFARVVEQGSFTAAAHAMALPKSSVTRGIARLETELGVRLIQRTTRQRGNPVEASRLCVHLLVGPRRSFA